jgi:hypothetical protein
MKKVDYLCPLDGDSTELVTTILLKLYLNEVDGRGHGPGRGHRPRQRGRVVIGTTAPRQDYSGGKSLN